MVTSAATPAYRPAEIARTTRLRLLVVPMLALAACSTTRVVSDYDRGTRFSSLHSFTIKAHPHAGTTNAQERTQDAVSAALTSKGFIYVADEAEADFVVDVTIAASDRLDVRSYPSQAGPWFHAGWSGNQVDVNQYQEGTLAIDVLDARSGKAVWHGSARKKLFQSDIANAHVVIREAVTAVLANFPPKDLPEEGAAGGRASRP